MRSASCWLCLLLCGVFVAGCGSEEVSGCTTTADCPVGMLCVDGECTSRIDGAVLGLDAGSTDASLLDGGPAADAPLIDGGAPPDGGPPDVPCIPTDPPFEVCDGLDNDCDGAGDPSDCHSDLVAWYRLEGASGEVLDSAGMYLNGQQVGSLTRAAEGAVGGGIQLVGPDMYVQVDDAPAFSPDGALTVEAWVKPADCSFGGTRGSVVSKEEEFALVVRPRCRPGANVVDPATGLRVWNRPSMTIPLSEWSHIAMTFDGATLRLYVNGLEVEVGAGAMVAVADRRNPIRIGASGPGVDQFTGGIDEVKLWRTARTEQQLCEGIGRVYGATSPSCTAP